MTDTQVHISLVRSRDDDVWATGTIEGIVDETGSPRVFEAHAWNSHLVTLGDDAARQAYLAQQLLVEAKEFLPADTLPLAGPVTLTLQQVQDALSPPAPKEGP